MEQQARCHKIAAVVHVWGANEQLDVLLCHTLAKHLSLYGVAGMSSVFFTRSLTKLEHAEGCLFLFHMSSVINRQQLGPRQGQPSLAAAAAARRLARPPMLINALRLLNHALGHPEKREVFL